MVEIKIPNNESWFVNYSRYVLSESEKRLANFNEVADAILKSYQIVVVHCQNETYFKFKDDSLAALFILRFA